MLNRIKAKEESLFRINLDSLLCIEMFENTISFSETQWVAVNKQQQT